MVISDQLAEELGSKITKEFAVRKTVQQKRVLIGRVLGPRELKEEVNPPKGRFTREKVRRLANILVQVWVYTGSLDKY
eukprot:g6034.t1